MLTPPLLNKFLVWKGKVVTLTKGSDGLYRDPDGVIIAIENEYSKDPIARCGVGLLSLSADSKLTSICRVHDYMYNSLAYQVFHTRDAADLWLYETIQKTLERKWYGSIIGPFFYWIPKLFGARYWENEATR